MVLISVEQDGTPRKTSASFYRGENTNFFPRDSSFDRPDFIEEYLIKGWMPDRGFVTDTTPIVAFGSCFAANISRYLHQRGYAVLTEADAVAYVSRMGDGIVNTHAILQQFEWAWNAAVPTQPLWHGYDAADHRYDETVRQHTRALFDRAEVFIITLGLSEIWYDEPTGEVFWRAVPREAFDPSRHKFRVASFAETLANLGRIHALIRAHRPGAAIVFTVSPIPLAATFRPVCALAANAASKAILRAAVDEFHRATAPLDPRLFYFPSYDLITQVFQNPWREDRRHPFFHILDFNMGLFEHFFCDPGLSRDGLTTLWQTARRLDREIAAAGDSVRAAQGAAEVTAHRETLRAERIAARIAARKAARRAQRAGGTAAP